MIGYEKYNGIEANELLDKCIDTYGIEKTFMLMALHGKIKDLTEDNRKTYFQIVSGNYQV